jgi:hypothetical protein
MCRVLVPSSLHGFIYFLFQEIPKTLLKEEKQTKNYRRITEICVVRVKKFYAMSVKKQRKLILHFDQHNTIQVACKLPGRNITVEEGLNNFLTSVTWGEEMEDGAWEWRCDEPQFEKPRRFKKSVTYFKYLEKLIVKSPDDRPALRKLTCNFVFEEPGSKFREFYDAYLKNLKYNLTANNVQQPTYSQENLPANTVIGWDNQTLYHFILPGFFDFIRRLQQEKRDFSIILRTMGVDSLNFLEAIKPVFEGRHPYFPDIKPMNINPMHGHIRRGDNNEVELELEGQVYKNEKDIYEKLSGVEGIYFNLLNSNLAHVHEGFEKILET